MVTSSSLHPDGGHSAAVSVSAARLLVTALFEHTTQQYFQNLRHQYFPPERNIVPAHLSLFHKLPAEERTTIERDIEAVTQSAAWPASATGLRSIGRGFAVSVECAALMHAREQLATRWQQWLTPQDRQRFWPHVVFQNKVEPDVPRDALSHATSQWRPVETRIVALALWTYRNGPWELEREFPLAL